MTALLLAATLLFSPSLYVVKDIDYFPGSYFDSECKARVHRRALSYWPGPSGLLDVWNSGAVSQRKKIGILLGASAFHSPTLLPMYLEAIEGPNGRLRQAAAYGYRDLLGDRTPDVSRGISPAQSAALAGEVRAVTATLRAHTLIEMWVAALLAGQEQELPGYRGIVLRRSSADCLKALDRLVRPEDLNLIARAYRLSDQQPTRLSLLRLIEGLTLKRFMHIPKGENAVWGVKNYEHGLAALDYWLGVAQGDRCVLDYEKVLSLTLADMGAPGVAPMDPSSCGVWLRVLHKGDPNWWPVAARRLYDCGGPPAELSILQPDTKRNTQIRDGLLKWYGLR